MDKWKNARGEQEMLESGKEIMKKAAKDNKKAEDEKWNKVKEKLYTGDSVEDSFISFTIEKMKIHYQLPQELKK